ncbi:hypothetical protein [Abyssalbus ytuae]|uniref:Uncharacterized protein n=1 Tax=Abyssalbus ytuae TaxID=2926907 RepID=A0A9E6ZQC1_9FLAO|nr:hypothetical protein [Abyssalbus ytuae]UOB16833.1 hypothetical protein MQE35_13945 [Abyssalbus ytuae]
MRNFLFTLLLLVSYNMFSQGTADNGDMYTEFLTNQTEEIGLQDEKKDKFIEISQKYFEKSAEVRNSDESRFSKFKKFKSISNEKDNELKTLLSEEEFKKYKSIQQENRKLLKERYKENKNKKQN